MSRTAAKITQADIARAIRAAKQAGAAELEVRSAGGATILIRISPSTAPNVDLAAQPEIVVL